MPGLYGVVAKDASVSGRDLHQIGRRMCAALRVVPWLKTELYTTDFFCGGRVHLGIRDAEVQPLSTDDARLHAWFDGSCRSAPAERLGTPRAELFRDLLAGDGGALSRLDGVFSLACLQNGRELTIATDRLGFRPLYYTETEHWFAYAAEVKALLAARDGLPPIDDLAVRQYFGFDHMLGDRTWWRGIELVPPGSVWHITGTQRIRHRYWSFGDIRSNQVDAESAQQAFGNLWQRDVEHQRCHGRRVPLLLSGGQDSRLLLAELLAQGADVVAITYGSPTSPEVGPSRLAAAAAGVDHHVCEWNPDNWWNGREEGIWQTDGLVNANHLHPVIARDHLRAAGAHSLMNIVGDLLFGGSHLEHASGAAWRERPESLLERRYMGNPFFSTGEVLEASVDDARKYSDGPSSDCFHLLQRVRRYVLHSPGCLGSFCETVFPGVSHDLLQLFLGGLTDGDRAHHKFYNRFLVARYPKYFANIPWQPTGRGLAESFPTRVVRGLRRRLRHVIGISGGFPPANQWFVDYPACVRQHRVKERLLDADLLMDEILGGRVRQALQNDPVNPLAAESVIAILTMETYLRQVGGRGSVFEEKRQRGRALRVNTPSADPAPSELHVAQPLRPEARAAARTAAASAAAPLVTVVIPTYNRGSRILRALQSLQQQTFNQWEAIVVDDGSTDDTQTVVNHFAVQDRRVRLVRLPTNRGAQSARNAGIRAARASWIAFLDSDDWYVPDSLELRLARARQAGVQVVHSDCYVLTVHEALERYDVAPLSGMVYRTLLRREGPVFPTLLVRSEALRRIGYLDERIEAFQEWDTTIRLARRYAFGYERTPTFIYDCRGSDTMSKDRLRGARGYEQIVVKHCVAMLCQVGPTALASHYRIAADWYRAGGRVDEAERCLRLAGVWAFVNPVTAWHRIRRLTEARKHTC